jgi:hypothetical protein
MAAINGKFKNNLTYFRDNSHPGLISMTRKDGSKLDISSPDSRQEENECLDSVVVEAASRKETKTLIWITAKDKSNKHSILLTFEFRLRSSSPLCSENWKARKVCHQCLIPLNIVE